MRRRRGPWSANTVGLLFVALGLFVLIGGYNYPQRWWLSGFVQQVYPNSGADLIGASIVILLVDRFARQREDQERRRQLVRECASTDHAVADRALLELEARGWLADGALVEADLTGANLTRAKLEAADLSRAMLIGTRLESANLSRAVLVGAALGGADLSRAVLEWARLTDAKLSGASLHAADAAHAEFQRADLTHADLSDADLSRTDLSGADLREADLSGAILTAALLDGVRLDAARFDRRTRWPVGFQPPGSGRALPGAPRPPTDLEPGSELMT